MVRTKAIQGSWRDFDYEEVAKSTRYHNVAIWLRANKPNLKELLWKGKRTGYYLCMICEDAGDRHIIKCFENDPLKLKTQNLTKHFQTKMHDVENRRKSMQVSMTKEFIAEMENTYLKMLAQEKVHATLFSSPSFKEMITAFANQLTGGVDPDSIAKMFPSATTIKRRLKDTAIEIESKYIDYYCLDSNQFEFGNVMTRFESIRIRVFLTGFESIRIRVYFDWIRIDSNSGIF